MFRFTLKTTFFHLILIEISTKIMLKRYWPDTQACHISWSQSFDLHRQQSCPASCRSYSWPSCLSHMSQSKDPRHSILAIVLKEMYISICVNFIYCRTGNFTPCYFHDFLFICALSLVIHCNGNGNVFHFHGQKNHPF